MQEEDNKENVILSEQDKYDIVLQKQKWKNRRQMAWACLWFFFACSSYIILWMPDEKIRTLDEVFAWIAIFCVTTIGAYMGTTVAADIQMTKGKMRK